MIASLLLDLSDPFNILGILTLSVVLYGFGFMHGEAHERNLWWNRVKRIARLRKEGLIP